MIILHPHIHACQRVDRYNLQNPIQYKGCIWRMEGYASAQLYTRWPGATFYLFQNRPKYKHKHNYFCGDITNNKELNILYKIHNRSISYINVDFYNL